MVHIFMSFSIFPTKSLLNAYHHAIWKALMYLWREPVLFLFVVSFLYFFHFFFLWCSFMKTCYAKGVEDCLRRPPCSDVSDMFNPSHFLPSFSFTLFLYYFSFFYIWKFFWNSESLEEFTKNIVISITEIFQNSFGST